MLDFDDEQQARLRQVATDRAVIKLLKSLAGLKRESGNSIEPVITKLANFFAVDAAGNSLTHETARRDALKVLVGIGPETYPALCRIAETDGSGPFRLEVREAVRIMAPSVPDAIKQSAFGDYRPFLPQPLQLVS
jgi:hypothetical protein